MTEFDRSWDALLQPHTAHRLFDLKSPPPFKSPQHFDSAFAWWMAGLSQSAYLWNATHSDIPPAAGYRNNVLEKNGFKELAFIDEGAIQGVVVERGGSCIIAFRGTDELPDWNVNIRINTVQWPGGGKVHQGFFEAFNSIAAQLRALRLQYSDYPWFLTGHSQGAAIAILATSIIHPRATYAFGCPRLCDSDCAARLGPEWIFQIVNGNDVVTRLPPAIGDFDTCLPGRIYHIVDGNIQTMDDTSEPLEALDLSPSFQRLITPEDWGLPIQELYDHAIVNYIAAIERWLFK